MALDVAISFLPVLACLVLYLRKLSARLHGPHPAARPSPPMTTDELSHVSYEGIDMLTAIPSQATMKGYIVVGGSGYLGSYVVKLLLLRGEVNIRIVDLVPPPADFMGNLHVSYTKADVTSLPSVRTALLEPFPSTGRPVDVILHTAALIRFWERASYCMEPSYDVNVLGMKNVLQVAQELPSAILVFTSTADAAIPSPKFMRLGLDYASPPYNTVNVSDFDNPLPPHHAGTSCYTRSKVMAEDLVKKANGHNGLRTAIIRPGYTITGPNDRLITSTLTMPRTPVWDKLWSQTYICVWDAAAALLVCEDALEHILEEVGGKAFLVTGKGPAWRMRDVRNAVKYYADRPIHLDELPPLLVYILAHIMEVFMFLRYHLLLFLYLPFGSKPSLIPKWMGQLAYLQPATFEYMADVVIDDSRARKILGYRPQWETAQCIRYAVDMVQSGKTGTHHGLQQKYL